ncbi:MAG: hypothetical protein ACRDD8_09695 [Bacteroidales bacterium]
MNKVIFKAVRDVNSPQREGSNAGYDLFVPKFTPKFLKEFYRLNSAYINYLVGTDTPLEKFISEHMHTDSDGKRYLNITPIKESVEHATHYNIKIPSGITYRMEDDKDPSYTYKMENKNKSGVASKNSVFVGACVMDMEYRDEAIINLIGLKPLKLVEDGKMVQVVIERVETPEISFIPYGSLGEIFDDECTNRGGGFNSTGGGI